MERVKIFSDGSLGAETAALRIIDDTRGGGGADAELSHHGVLIHGADEMSSMIALAKRKGYRLEIHAIGDAAAEQVLHAMKGCGICPDDRAILTHCQVRCCYLFIICMLDA